MSLLVSPPNESHKTGVPALKQATPSTPVSLEHESVTIDKQSDSKLFALIIGVNKYTKISALTGAVADADAISDFLTTDLKVPTNHIINLRDESATREAIIKALRSLKDDPRIHKGDPILIFYAGHGGLKKASDEWKARHSADEMQVIFPWDYNMEIPNSKEVVNCIPDRTIGALLNGLAAAKGDNITVIFDSCHSASSNRGGDDNDGTGRRARSADVDIEVPVDIDSDILSSKQNQKPDIGGNDSRRPEPLLCTNQSSHIHFAACGSDEKAWEEQGRGAFTVALLKTIRGSGVDKITYRNLMTSLPMLPKQSPHCYGLHKSRILFNSRVPSRKVTFIPVKVESDVLILNAGASSGVTLGSIWELHASATEDSPTLGCLKAHTPSVSSTALAPEDDATRTKILNAAKSKGESRLYARQVQSGTGNELKVYFSPEAKQLIFFDSKANPEVKSAIGKGYHEVGYVVHPSRDSADMAVEVYNPANIRHGAKTEVEFFLFHPQAEKYDLSRMRHRKPARLQAVEPVLFAAARWNWHLKRTNDSERSSSTVSAEMMKVCEMYGDYSVPVEGPLVNLNETGVVDLVVKDEDRYGLKISSEASAPLYIQVFYFDLADLSISKMFGFSHSNGKQDPEVPARGEFMVGDDGEGGNSMRFAVTPGVLLELGFMKLFWSTDQLELDGLDQDPPFGDEEDQVVGSGSRKVFMGERKQVKDWGTVLVTLVQRA
ncbi:hypothetical protein BDV93DRAFT_591117 [Ceratobasidium sp. AG-I]|nr:hypothetical protein BDV93DRAFT_591117 [Ceratobasidium sp. AG-I]